MSEQQPMAVDVERVLRGNGITDRPDLYDSDIHSWRCSYPDIYDHCSCFQELRDELAALLTTNPAAVAAREQMARPEESA